MTLFALKELNIAGNRCMTVKFDATKSITQCQNCQKFDHMHNTCKESVVCAICSKNHETRSHKCHVCKKTDMCIHTIVKCVNCDQNYQANDQYCEVRLAIQAKSTKNTESDELAMQL